MANAYPKDIYEIEAEKVEYINETDNIIATGNAVAKNQQNKIISSDQIIYSKNKNIIETYGNSKFNDGKVNLSAESFRYSINKKIIEANKNVILIDIEKNKFYFDKLNYNEENQVGSGKNVKAYISDGSYLEAEKGQTDNIKQLTKLKNAKFTTCSNVKNKKNEFCPTWSLKSKNITHDKGEGKIIHSHAFLRFKNIPVFYSPYLTHPDPSVKRQSGFLPPLIKTISNIGRTFRTPYYWAISEDKDLTITPVYHFDEKQAILSTYRQAFKKSNLIIETGYSGGYKRLNKTGRTKGSRNYFFANYDKIADELIFKKNEIKLKIERISQENFVRVNQINTTLFNEDIRELENSIKISSYGENKRLEIRTGIFENLETQDTSKYTYYLPDGIYSYNKNLAKKLKLNFNTYFQGSKFLKNQKQFKLRNLLSVDSNQIINKKKGVGTIFKTNFFNKNIYNENVTNAKENENIDNNFTFAIDNYLPFAKFNKNSYQILKPRIFAKYTTGKQLDIIDSQKILNYSDVFSMNRTNDLDSPETGASIGYGLDHVYKKKNNDNSLKFKTSSGFGQVIRSYREDKLSNISSLNNKSSDFAGFLKFDYFGNELNFNSIEDNKDKVLFISDFDKNKISIDYNFNLSNNLVDLNRNNLSINGTYNKLYSSLTFDEKNEHIGDERTVTFDIKKLFNQNYYLKFEGKRNLKTNNSEFHNVSFNFENDCLSSALTLSKAYYSDQDITSSKSLIFSVIIKPFSDDFSPDLTNFIN